MILLFPALAHAEETVDDLADTSDSDSGLLHQHLESGAETLLLGSGIGEVFLLQQVVQVDEKGGCEGVGAAPLFDARHQRVAVQSHEADGFQLREVAPRLGDGCLRRIVRFDLCQDVSAGVDEREAGWESECVFEGWYCCCCC